MNKIVADSLHPLYKAEIFEYSIIPIEGLFTKTSVKVKARLFQKDSTDSLWNIIYEGDIDSILIACAHIATLHSKAVNGDELPFLGSENMELKNIRNDFPFRKIIVEEYLYGKDSGNSWDDPYNDIRKKVKLEYYIQRGINSQWVIDYEEYYNFFDYSILNAGLTDIKLLERIPFEFSPISWNYKKDEDIVMFEAQSHMFKFVSHCYKQKCVIGEAITNYYNDCDDDNSIKVSYLEDVVFLYHKNEIVLFMNKLFINGECIIDTKDLITYNIDKDDIVWGNPNFREWVKLNYPHTKSVKTLMSSYVI